MKQGTSEIDAETEEAADVRTKHRSHGFKAFRRRFGRAIAPTLGAVLVRALSKTWRTREEGHEHITEAREQGRGYFMALWHGRMLIPAVRHSRQGYCVLVSPSGDGDVSEALLKRIGYEVIRGSSSRRARRALRAMLQLLEAGTPIAITPDGPRGPPRSMNPGLAWMASATGFPVIPCGFVAEKAWRLRSWDRFTIPKPFSRVAFVYGAPYYVPREANSNLDPVSDELRALIDRAERRGFEILGMEPNP